MESSRPTGEEAQSRPVPLLVLRSHSHGDHVFGDAQFAGLPNVQVVKA